VVMQIQSPPTESRPSVLNNLPDYSVQSTDCPRRARLQIDLILLAIEALDLGGSEAILLAAQELELKGVIQNRVSLWRLRTTNPFRRANQRRSMTLTEAKALVAIAYHLAKRLTIVIRQLLLAYQQLTEKGLELTHHFRLSAYLERFRAHFRARMNPKRAGVMAYDTDEKLNELALQLLGQLLFLTGTHGLQRFWSSLLDGEVA